MGSSASRLPVRSGSARLVRAGWLVLAVVLGAVVLSACGTADSREATAVTTDGATLQGAVSADRDEQVSYWFEYGTTTSYGTETARKTMSITDRVPHPVSEAITGLPASTTHHFQLCVESPDLVHCGADKSFTTDSAEPTELSITAQPVLYPQFNPQVSDYVTRCGSDPVSIDVTAPAGTDVAIDGATARSGRFSQDVAVSTGQRFTMTTVTGSQVSTFHVRCLPVNFPAWTYERTGQPSQEWTLLGLATGTNRYVAFYDRSGVPVYWRATTETPIDAKLLSGNRLAFAQGPAGGFGTDATRYEIRRLDGTLLRTVKTVNAPTDHHELLELSNGNLLILSYKRRDNVDLSAHGSSSTSVLDAEIQELAPDGSLVWSWNSKDHIALSETEPWWAFLRGTPSPVDIVHINSIEVDGDSLLISMRHTDAIYSISRSDGHVEWKLGGTTTAQSLTVSGDPLTKRFGGQHDARRLADGTVAIHDNGTQLGRPPRAVRFQIDETAKTATFAEALTDPEVTTSLCCGSARKLASGGWLMGWGTLTSPVIGEYSATGSRIFKLVFPNGFSYRAFPVPTGVVSAGELRQAMDTMAPR